MKTALDRIAKGLHSVPPMPNSKRYASADVDTSSSTGPRAVQPGERATCGVHGDPLICPRCLGSAGGRRRSKKKTAAARENARQPRPNARGKKKPRKAAAAAGS